MNDNKSAYREAVEMFTQYETKHLEMMQRVLVEELSKRKDESLQAAIVQINKIVQSTGCSIEDLMRIKSKNTIKSTKPKLPAKFQHPTDASLQWSGVGNAPKWIKNCANDGVDIETLRIKA